MPYQAGHYNQDCRQLIALHRRFGTVPLKTMPTISVPQYLYYVLIEKIRQIPFLNYIDYNKNEAKQMLTREIGWRDYGGKHYESVYTRFFQGYYLPTKFGFDKRRPHLSSLICSGHITRAQALNEIQAPPYDPSLLNQDMEVVIKKLGLTKTEFETLLRLPPRSAREYPNHYFLFHSLQKYKNLFRRIGTSP